MLYTLLMMFTTKYLRHSDSFYCALSASSSRRLWKDFTVYNDLFFHFQIINFYAIVYYIGTK